MQSQANEPLSSTQLLDLLNAMAQRFDQISSQGIALNDSLILGESNDELQIQDYQNRIQSHNNDLIKLQTQLKKIKQVVRRRREVMRQNK